MVIYGTWPLIATVVLDAPAFADNAIVALNFEWIEHPVKSIVTGVVTEPFAAMLPSETGNEGLVMEGVHGGPRAWVSVKLSI